MKTLIALGAVAAMVSLTGCTTGSPQNNTAGSAAYTSPKNFNYDNSTGQATVPAGINTQNPGSMFNPNDTSENNDL